MNELGSLQMLRTNTRLRSMIKKTLMGAGLVAVIVATSTITSSQVKDALVQHKTSDTDYVVSTSGDCVIAYLQATRENHKKYDYCQPGHQEKFGVIAQPATSPVLFSSVKTTTAAEVPIYSFLIGVITRTPGAGATSRGCYRIAAALSHSRVQLVKTPQLEPCAPWPGVTEKSVSMDYTNTVDTRDEMFVNVNNFLTALLTTRGDMSAYAVPELHAQPLQPQQFDSFTLTTLLLASKEKNTARVLAKGRGISAQQNSRPIEYALHLSYRDHWLIESFDSFPHLQGSRNN